MRASAGIRRLLGRRIGVHDRHQFELKLEYAPEPHASRYTVEAFVCVPGNLNINPHTSPPASIYTDIHNYVRLKTPALSWSELAALPDSPLVSVCEQAPRVREGGDPARFVHECRLFACILRASLRDFADQVQAAVAAGPSAVAGVRGLADATLAGAGMVAAQFRGARAIVEDTAFPAAARAAYRLADEYASVSLEQQLRRAVVFLAGAATDTSPLRRRLLDALLAEESYRRERGYPSILDPDTDNERYVHRNGLLKKYCSSVLFLHVQRHAARAPWQHVLAAAAAGIAMAFATVIAFWAQARWLGVRLFAILVVAYMFKDRIKEWAKSVFATFLERRLYDHRIIIQDPEGGRLGTCREKIDFVRPDRLPEDVAAIRHHGADPVAMVAEQSLDETVFCYRKEIEFDPGRLHGRRGGAAVTDIVRFHITRLLREMDEPYQTIQWIDRESLALVPMRAAKVYHVDVVFRFTSREGEPPAVTLMRLVLDRKGIKRIERFDRKGSTAPA